MLDQSEGVMAKRTKRATARKVKAGSKAPKKSKTAKKQAASRLVKAKPKRQKAKVKPKAKAKPKRSVAKKPASRRPRRTIPPSPLQTETTIVDVVEELVPGVVVVTELVETHTRKPDTTNQLGADWTAAPQSEEK